jgi:para-nitrobenzyl esterase
MLDHSIKFMGSMREFSFRGNLSPLRKRTSRSMARGIISDQAKRTVNRQREKPRGSLTVYSVIYTKPWIYWILTCPEESRPAARPVLLKTSRLPRKAGPVQDGKSRHPKRFLGNDYFEHRFIMKILFLAVLFPAFFLFALSPRAETLPADCARTVNGIVQGVTDSATGIHIYMGIPFAAPPVGDLRWREPQPVKNWEGIRPANKFGPQAMQKFIFGDMVFRSDGTSEDCLYLNVWTPAKSAGTHLPVLVYFYGGGFMAGDGSELRYDGESMAQRGIVVVTVNYRLNIFGFFAHPELTEESPNHASGNYGLLDQNAALQWVQKNIQAFGGNPKKVTIDGESAGSISVSAQMASPLAKGLFARAIGESGSLLGTLPPIPLPEAEQTGLKFAHAIGANSLADLRALPAKDLLEKSFGPKSPRFGMTIDGYFLSKDPVETFSEGEQAHVPLLVGWNSEEGNPWGVLGTNAATPENLAKSIKNLYGTNAAAIAKVYSAQNDSEALQAAMDLSGDRFIGLSTWKWSDLQRKTGGKPVYRYYYSHPRPVTVDGHPQELGAVHASDIDYVMGNLARNKVFAWTDDDYRVSNTLETYFANFVKKGNPNGDTLPYWPANSAKKPVEVMHIDVQSSAQPESHPDRYPVLDQATQKP